MTPASTTCVSSATRRLTGPGPVAARITHLSEPAEAAAGLGEHDHAREPHYYRRQGPRFLAEWDNTQRGANHGHSVWRDPVNDFGLDVLAGHRGVHH